MNDTTITQTATRSSQTFLQAMKQPGLLIAYSPPGACTVDRCRLAVPFTAGRGKGVNLLIQDSKVSKRHFQISHSNELYFIEDTGSTNGTFVNGQPVTARQLLEDGAVIRAGRAVMVFHLNATPMLYSPQGDSFGMVGPFHLSPLLDQLHDASESNRHVLLVGPSGCGKELAARAVANMSHPRNAPYIVFNSARFTSEDEVVSTLFGVTKKVFSGVDDRPGIIEQAHGGTLFLDEVHGLPQRVQRSLLRIMEDGQFSRIGESQPRTVSIQFVFAGNASGPHFGLTHDFVARVRVVPLKSLNERRADIPAIFNRGLTLALQSRGLSPNDVIDQIRADHYETLCLNDYTETNIRGLLDIADRIASQVARGVSGIKAVLKVFSDFFGDSHVAIRHLEGTQKTGESHHYETHRRQIIQAYEACNGNLSATERTLREMGIMCTRRWLGIYLDRWGIREKPSR